MLHEAHLNLWPLAARVVIDLIRAICFQVGIQYFLTYTQPCPCVCPHKPLFRCEIGAVILLFWKQLSVPTLTRPNIPTHQFHALGNSQIETKALHVRFSYSSTATSKNHWIPTGRYTSIEMGIYLALASIPLAWLCLKAYRLFRNHQRALELKVPIVYAPISPDTPLWIAFQTAFPFHSILFLSALYLSFAIAALVGSFMTDQRRMKDSAMPGY